jgi:hypothetical protein
VPRETRAERNVLAAKPVKEMPDQSPAAVLDVGGALVISRSRWPKLVTT